MKDRHNPDLTDYAKVLRKCMTKEERHLWYDYLRNYPVRFLRQKVIGNTIVYFYCASAKLVIELDGSQHYEGEGLLRDRVRTERKNQSPLVKGGKRAEPAGGIEVFCRAPFLNPSGAARHLPLTREAQ
jgi:hypothetical protein